MCPVPGPMSRALWGVRGGMRKPSPARRVRVVRPWMAISTVPATMYPTSSPGWVCQPDSTPAGISVSTCTMSRPGIDDGLCWISARLSLLASASRGGCGLAAGYVTKISSKEAAAAAADGSPGQGAVGHAARSGRSGRPRHPHPRPGPIKITLNYPKLLVLGDGGGGAAEQVREPRPGTRRPPPWPGWDGLDDFGGEDPARLLPGGQLQFLLGAGVRVQTALARADRRVRTGSPGPQDRGESITHSQRRFGE